MEDTQKVEKIENTGKVERVEKIETTGKVERVEKLEILPKLGLETSKGKVNSPGKRDSSQQNKGGVEPNARLEGGSAEESKKVKKSDWQKKFCFLYIGVVLITTFNSTTSNSGFIISYFGLKNYTILNFVSSIPNILIALFIPKILQFLGRERMSMINIIVQIIACFALLFTESVSNGPLLEGQKHLGKNISAYIYLISFTILSQFSFAISQTTFFSLASDIGSEMVQFLITGYSLSGVIVSVFFFILKSADLSMQSAQYFRYSFALLIHFISVPVTIQILKFHSESADETQRNEKEEEKEKDTKKILIKVLKEKYPILIANIFLFFFVFIAFPNLMFSAKTKNKLLMKHFNTILMFLFGIAEFSARLLNSFDFKFIRKIINNITIYIFVSIACLICIIPVVFYVQNGKGKWFGVGTDAVFIITYFLLAFNLGMLGNNIAKFANENLELGVETETIGMYLSFTIVLAISAGIGVSTAITGVKN